MKKYIATFSIIAALFFTTQVKAQQEETYEKANTLIEDLLKNPDISASDKEALKEALKQTNDAIKELKSPDVPVYSTEAPKNNKANYDHAPTAVKPKPTPVINGNSNRRSDGRTLISGNGN
jgi:hypothetical protein